MNKGFVLVVLILIVACYGLISCGNEKDTEQTALVPITTTPLSTSTIEPTEVPSPIKEPPTPHPPKPLFPREAYKYKLHIEADYREGDLPEFCDTKVEYIEKHDRGEGHGFMTLPYSEAPYLEPFTRTFSIKSHGCSSMHGGLYQFSHWELDGVVIESPDDTITVTVDDNNLERTLVAVFKWQAMN